MASSDNVVHGAQVCLVQKCAWSAKSPAPQMCLLRQRFQPGVTISLLSLQSRGTCMCVCVCVCVCVHMCTYAHARTCMCVCDSEEEVPLGIGCSTGEDKVVWCLLTWPMIHNWGRTAVAGCTDRSQGWWQMIGPCGAKLSLTLGELFPNVHCPLSAHLSFMSLPCICKPGSRRPTICLTSLNITV